MALEIERKFLIDPDRLPLLPEPLLIRQGYIPAGDTTVRVRTMNGKGFLTLKGVRNGFTRSEFEYIIPYHDALSMLNELCPLPLIEKRRYRLEHGKHLWEIDIFEGENRGLFLAEVELEDEAETVELPSWVTKEVTQDRRYANANLRTHPFSQFRQ